MNWEIIQPLVLGEEGEVNLSTLRCRVPGGWLVTVEIVEWEMAPGRRYIEGFVRGGGVTFVPDPKWEWVP